MISDSTNLSWDLTGACYSVCRRTAVPVGQVDESEAKSKPSGKTVVPPTAQNLHISIHTRLMYLDEGFVSTHHYPSSLPAGRSPSPPHLWYVMVSISVDRQRRSHPSGKVHKQRHDPRRNVVGLDACTTSYVTLSAYERLPLGVRGAGIPAAYVCAMVQAQSN